MKQFAMKIDSINRKGLSFNLTLFLFYQREREGDRDRARKIECMSIHI